MKDRGQRIGSVVLRQKIQDSGKNDEDSLNPGIGAVGWFHKRHQTLDRAWAGSEEKLSI